MSTYTVAGPRGPALDACCFTFAYYRLNNLLIKEAIDLPCLGPIVRPRHVWQSCFIPGNSDVYLFYIPSYVYIPILPESLLDFLTAPTPFLMGVHMSYKRHIPDLVCTLNYDK